MPCLFCMWGWPEAPRPAHLRDVKVVEVLSSPLHLLVHWVREHKLGVHVERPAARALMTTGLPSQRFSLSVL